MKNQEEGTEEGRRKGVELELVKGGFEGWRRKASRKVFFIFLSSTRIKLTVRKRKIRGMVVLGNSCSERRKARRVNTAFQIFPCELNLSFLPFSLQLSPSLLLPFPFLSARSPFQGCLLLPRTLLLDGTSSLRWRRRVKLSISASSRSRSTSRMNSRSVELVLPCLRFLTSLVDTFD